MRIPFIRQSRDHRIDSRILVAFLLLAVATFAFLTLASEVVEGDTFAFDKAILQGLRSASRPTSPIGPGWLRAALIDITSVGGVTVLTLITAIVAGYLFAVRKATTAMFLIAAIAGGAIVSTVLKVSFGRARPDLVGHLVETHTLSFPSGHAMNSAVTFLTLGALLARTERSRPVRIYVMAVAVMLTLLIGFSRVYLGVHWPSDVLAGWCVGSAWAVLCSLLASFLQRKGQIEPPGAGAQ